MKSNNPIVEYVTSKALTKPSLGDSIMSLHNDGHNIDRSFNLKLSGSNVTTTQLSASLNPSSKE